MKEDNVPLPLAVLAICPLHLSNFQLNVSVCQLLQLTLCGNKLNKCNGWDVIEKCSSHHRFLLGFWFLMSGSN